MCEEDLRKFLEALKDLILASKELKMFGGRKDPHSYIYKENWDYKVKFDMSKEAHWAELIGKGFSETIA